MTDTTAHWKLPRLYVAQKIDTSKTITLDKEQTHYLKNVMRRNAGDAIRIFDGQSGEFLTTIQTITKKETTLTIENQIKRQPTTSHRTHLLFTPLAKNRMDMVIEKSIELGVTDLHPILTNRTEHRKINTARIQNQIIEASEQCERLTLPTLRPLSALNTALADWQHTPAIQWCCERDAIPRQPLGHCTDTNQAFLIGPAGGFDDQEFQYIKSLQVVTPISLGKDILRAETASLLTLSARKLQLLRP